MGKRFTATEKWTDRWFRALPSDQKLGWFYLLDNCDQAGVIDLDRELADFQVGTPVDWDALFLAAGPRIEGLAKGKAYLTGFISYQYGTLSSDCNAHKPVFSSLKKHGLDLRVLEGYPKGSQRVQDKDKDKDKDKEGGSGGKPKRFIRPTVEEVRAYCLERGNGIDPQDFIDSNEQRGWLVGKNKTPMSDWKAAVRVWENSREKPKPRAKLLTPEQEKLITAETFTTGLLSDGTSIL